MPATKTRYLCNVCGREFIKYEAASHCEKMPIPPKKCEIGQAVKLKSRKNVYTVAIVRDMMVGNAVLPHWEMDENKFLKEDGVNWTPHCWVLKLDRKVFLDDKWEDKTDEVSDLYVLTEEEAKNMLLEYLQYLW